MITPEEVFWSYRLGRASRWQHLHSRLCRSSAGCGCGGCDCGRDGGGDGGGCGGGLVLQTRASNS